MADNYSLKIEQGATLEKEIRYKDNNGNPISLVGYAAKMQIRNQKDNTLVIELSTSNGKITIDENKLTFIISATETGAMSLKDMIYDLEITKDGVVTRLLQGNVVISKEVTV